MGIFDGIRAMKQAASAGGNYGFIAQNMACIYYIIGQTDFGKSLSEEQRLYVTGVFDTMQYIMAGQITYEELQRDVLSAKIGELGYKKHRELFDSEPNQDLIAYVMCIELLIFEEENTHNVNYSAIIDSIISQKPLIAKTVNKTLEEGTHCPIYKDVINRGILNLLNDKSFQDFLLEYKGVEGN